MRISLVIPSLAIGGAELLVKDIANELTKQQISVQVIVLSNKLDIINELNESVRVDVIGDKYLSSFSGKAFFQVFFQRKKFIKIVNDFAPDHIIAHLPIAHHFCRVTFLNNKMNYKIWMHHHSLQYLANPVNTFSQKVLLEITRYLSKKVDYGHFFISKAVEENIFEKIKVKNCFIIYNAIKDQFAHISKSTNPFKNIDYFNIVVPGRLVKEKGHIKFLELIKSELQEKNDIRVWIIGEGPKRNEIESLIRKNELNDKVFLIGALSNTELLEYIYHSNIVIIPSLIEGLGIVAIETTMLDKLCVVSNAGGLPEIITNKENGIVFDLDNYSKLNQIISDIYNGKLKKIDFRIRESYINNFEISSFVKKLLSILEINKVLIYD